MSKTSLGAPLPKTQETQQHQTLRFECTAVAVGIQALPGLVPANPSSPGKSQPEKLLCSTCGIFCKQHTHTHTRTCKGVSVAASVLFLWIFPSQRYLIVLLLLSWLLPCSLLGYFGGSLYFVTHTVKRTQIQGTLKDCAHCCNSLTRVEKSIRPSCASSL